MLVFWALLALGFVIYCSMMVLTVPVLLREAGGLKPFDLRPFGYSYEEVQQYLGTISEEGIATYLGLQHQLDFVYPLVLAAMFIVAFRRFLGPVGGMVMSVVAIVGAIADYSENALVASILTDPASREQVTLASAMTIAKSASGTACFIMLLIIAMRSWQARRAPTPRRRKTGKSA